MDYKNQIRLRLQEYVESITHADPNAGRNMYICPLCGSGMGRGNGKADGAFSIKDGGPTWHCFACGASGDIFDLIGMMENIPDFQGQYQQALTFFGYPTDESAAPVDMHTRSTPEDDFGEVNGTEDGARNNAEKGAGNGTAARTANGTGITAKAATINNRNDSMHVGFESEKEENEESEKTITNPSIHEEIKRYAAAIKGSAGEAYLHERGLSDSIISSLHLGYNTANRCITIPYPGEDYYVSRSIVDKDYKKPGGVTEPLFWIGKDKASLMVFITEGQIDAISLFQSGAALGGIGYTKLRDIPLPPRVIYVRDNDEAGQNAAKNVINLLEEKGIRHILTVAPPKGFKDSNDLLREDPEKLMALVGAWSRELMMKAPPDNVTQYMSTAFDNELVRFRSYKDRKTGFDNLDREIECLYPGLYVLGAISSLGKTTFAHQLADQLVQRGESVVYFTLEQSRMEMVTKGISRITALNVLNASSVRRKTAGEIPGGGTDGRASVRAAGGEAGMGERAGGTDLDQHAVSAIEIRRGAADPYRRKIVDSATKEYMERSKSLYMVQCDFDTTVETVQSYVSAFIKEKSIRPVVIVDYLQIIRPTDTKMTTKDAVDSHVRALKMLQRNNDLVLIVISSLNRSNYMAPIDFESFKESGGIEYTADVIWGLQLSIMNNSTFNSSQEVIKKRQIVKAAKKSVPRKIQLVCLKNRYGRSSYECDFDYYPQFDLFIPAAPSEFSDESEDIGAMIEQLGKKKARKKIKDGVLVEETLEEAPCEEEEMDFISGLAVPPELRD